MGEVGPDPQPGQTGLPGQGFRFRRAVPVHTVQGLVDADDDVGLAGFDEGMQSLTFGFRQGGEAVALFVLTIAGGEVAVQIHAVDVERGLLLVKGAVPGPRNGTVLVRTAAKGA